MPDLMTVLARRWKQILLLTLAATVLALVVSLLRPKQYLATVTALPANSAVADKARVFNNNIEGLYPELGSPDELDRIEGTAKLDTVFLAVARQMNLVSYYQVEDGSEKGLAEAADRLKKASDIRRSAYGELKINVWDGNAAVAAQMANALLQTLNAIHQRVQQANNAAILQKLKTEWQKKLGQVDSLGQLRLGGQELTTTNKITDARRHADSLLQGSAQSARQSAALYTSLTEQLSEFQKLIGQYELAVGTATQPLIVVEHARAAAWPDRPKVLQTTLLALAAGLLFSFLLALYAESRKPAA